jgi:ribose 5-phosphate isomerase B
MIIIGSDHAGFSLKQILINYLIDNKHEVQNVGTFSSDSVDYPDFAHLTAKHVLEFDCLGILICGSANGVSMAANKHKNIRCAICWDVEIAELARKHNNANILALPARFISEKKAIEIVEVFLNTSFEGGRHSKRVEKIGF